MLGFVLSEVVCLFYIYTYICVFRVFVFWSFLFLVLGSDLFVRGFGVGCRVGGYLCCES